MAVMTVRTWSTRDGCGVRAQRPWRKTGRRDLWRGPAVPELAALPSFGVMLGEYQEVIDELSAAMGVPVTEVATAVTKALDKGGSVLSWSST